VPGFSMRAFGRDDTGAASHVKVRS
jgi:hypothetical protein